MLNFILGYIILSAIITCVVVTTDVYKGNAKEITYGFLFHSLLFGGLWTIDVLFELLMSLPVWEKRVFRNNPNDK